MIYSCRIGLFVEKFNQAYKNWVILIEKLKNLNKSQMLVVHYTWLSLVKLKFIQEITKKKNTRGKCGKKRRGLFHIWKSICCGTRKISCIYIVLRLPSPKNDRKLITNTQFSSFQIKKGLSTHVKYHFYNNDDNDREKSVRSDYVHVIRYIFCCSCCCCKHLISVQFL